jgi:hypothetical protein
MQIADRCESLHTGQKTEDRKQEVEKQNATRGDYHSSGRRRFYS